MQILPTRQFVSVALLGLLPAGVVIASPRQLAGPPAQVAIFR